MEHKEFTAFETKIDDAQGVVDAIFAVFGNLDQGGDILHPGSMSKSFSERGSKIRLLDLHKTDSISRVLGKPLELKELSRNDLPQSLLQAYPDATGGAWGRFKFFMDTPEGKGAFIRIKEGGIDEWSIGYEALDHDFSKVRTRDGKEAMARNLRTIKVYDASPVLWGMNPATETLGAKDVDAPKPPDPVEDDGTDDQADPQPIEEKAGKEFTPAGPVRRLGDVLQGTIHQQFTWLADGYYQSGFMDTAERIALSSAIGTALEAFVAKAPAEVLARPLDRPWMDGPMVAEMARMAADASLETKAGRVLAKRNAARVKAIRKLLQELIEDGGLELDEDEGDEAPAKDKDKRAAEDSKKPEGKPTKAEAGPDTDKVEPPTFDNARLALEIELESLRLLEV